MSDKKLAAFLFLLAAAAGCGGQQIPGNGQLVVIDVDDGFYVDDLQVTPTTLQQQLLAARADGFFDDAFVRSEAAAVRAGVHYWNKLGANLHMADELQPGEDGPHFGVHRDEFSFPGESNAPIGTEWEGLPFVTIYTSVMRDDDALNYRKLREDVAHELGHAIGLQHLPSEATGTMTASIYWVGDSPSRDDQDAFCRLYPGCTRVWR